MANAINRKVGLLELLGDGLGRNLAEVRVVIGMVADLVAFVGDHLQHLGVLGRHVAEHEEGGLDAARLEGEQRIL